MSKLKLIKEKLIIESLKFTQKVLLCDLRQLIPKNAFFIS